MATSSERMRAWTGPAVLGFGFRPLFFLAGLWASLAMVLWIAMLSGHASLPAAFDPISWHAHEFLWGYLGAVMGGFLLTAVPNWTGRLPIVGWPLAGLVALWLLGRLVIACSAELPPLAVALCDLSFQTVLALALLREIVAGRNWRNLKVVGLLALSIAMNAVFHWQAAHGENPADGIATRGGVAVAVMLIALIGGRVVPSFTRNWLAKRSPGRLPAPLGRGDFITLGVTGAALAAWVVLPDAKLGGAACLLAGTANLWRLSRWCGRRTLSEPLVWVLHLGFLFVPIGFLLVGGAAFWPGAIPAMGALHAWLAGAIGTMTLAMMTRASLGHSGKALHADWRTTTIYLLILTAATARIAAGFLPGQMALLDLAGATWVLAFGGFAALYAPMFLLPRKIAGRAPNPR